MRETITHGSLFSGSGGFDQAARMNGIQTLWQSEIEPFPMRVLRKHFPGAVQLGDISRISGVKIEPVDIISGGSPCQDMSIAGNRDGLDGSRSTLFHEQIRIVKEMREKTNGEYPRFMVWENVPGAFSSNNGEDFRCVLKETIGIAEPDVFIPRPPGKKGKWSYAGAVMGDGYSVAWRTMDAQYWGVPQRRRRIYLVADFGGGCAPEILFERESLSWNPAQGGIAREGTAGSPADSTGTSGGGYGVPLENHPQDCRVGISPDGKVQTLTGKMGTGGGNVPLIMESKNTDNAAAFLWNNGADSRSIGYEKELAPTLKANKPPAAIIAVETKKNISAFGICSKDSNAMKSDNPKSGFYEATTSRTLDVHGGNPTCNQGGIVIVQEAYSIGRDCKTIGKEKASALTNHDTTQAIAQPYTIGNGQVHDLTLDEKARTLNCMHDAQALIVPIEGNGQRPSHKGSGYNESDKMFTLNATEQHAVAYATETEYIVRRLTPLECARLQGFEDDWTDGLVQEEPDAGTLQFFLDAWLEHWAVIGRGKGVKRPKNEKAVRRWLAAEPTDSDKYKLWGNGIALPCAFYVFEGIKKVLRGEAAET